MLKRLSLGQSMKNHIPASPAFRLFMQLRAFLGTLQISTSQSRPLLPLLQQQQNY